MCPRRWLRYALHLFIYKSLNCDQATYRSNFAPRDSRLIYDELRSALNSITLADPLHRLYLITPLYALPEPVWASACHPLHAYMTQTPAHIPMHAHTQSLTVHSSTQSSGEDGPA